MNFSALSQQLILNNQAINGIVNFAADMALIFEHLLVWFKLGGAVLFLWGVWGLITFKKPNSQVTGLSIALKCILGSVLYQFSFWMEQSTQSLWADASPATPMSYVALSQAQLDVNPLSAMLLAVLALLTLAGWVAGGMAIYGFATMESAQDKHGAFWKNAWMFLGGVILVNMMLFASDVAGSFLNMSGTIISASDF